MTSDRDLPKSQGKEKGTSYKISLLTFASPTSTFAALNPGPDSLRIVAVEHHNTD